METVAKKPTLEVTDKAAANVRRFAEAEGKQGRVLRVGVKGGGCSGLSYVLQFEGEERVSPLMDEVIEKGGVRVVVDRKSLLFLAGTTLDFEDGLMGQGFTFKNPNARQSCGCGESFSA